MGYKGLVPSIRASYLCPTLDSGNKNLKKDHTRLGASDKPPREA